MATTLLKASWNNLFMANYVIDPKVLLPYLSYGTELDLFEGKCYVSLVGFMFLDTKLIGIKFPFHTNFEEVNLRFYVKYNDKGTIKRGVVFIKEIVSKHMLALIANTLYNEKYERMPMKESLTEEDGVVSVSYEWFKEEWHSINVEFTKELSAIAAESEEEFITEHYWGYNKVNENVSTEYGVEHPRWSVYTLINHTIKVDFGKVYGADFEFLNNLQPDSVFVADGSKVVIKKGKKISS